MSRRTWHILGAVFTLIFGTLLHFTYDFFDKSTFWAIFSATDESTFSHLKLLFWPFVIFSLAEYFAYGRFYPRFLYVKLLSVLFGMAEIVILFYTYSGVLGFSVLFVDIFIFIIAVVSSYLLSYYLMKGASALPDSKKPLYILLFTVLISLVIVFTFVKPDIALFT